MYYCYITVLWIVDFVHVIMFCHVTKCLRHDYHLFETLDTYCNDLRYLGYVNVIIEWEEILLLASCKSDYSASVGFCI